jgi:oxidase EvaA
VPPFFAEIAHATGVRVRFSGIHSEEGGRFYHDQRLLTVVELPPDERIECPPDYLWLTLRDIKEMILRYGTVSVEARSLIACLPLGV